MDHSPLNKGIVIQDFSDEQTVALAYLFKELGNYSDLTDVRVTITHSTLSVGFSGATRAATVMIEPYGKYCTILLRVERGTEVLASGKPDVAASHNHDSMNQERIDALCFATNSGCDLHWPDPNG